MISRRGNEKRSLHARIARRGARCLEDDHAFLLKAIVFTEELIETFIDYKRQERSRRRSIAADPYEFALYYDV